MKRFTVITILLAAMPVMAATIPADNPGAAKLGLHDENGHKVGFLIANLHPVKGGGVVLEAVVHLKGKASVIETEIVAMSLTDGDSFFDVFVEVTLDDPHIQVELEAELAKELKAHAEDFILVFFLEAKSGSTIGGEGRIALIRDDGAMPQ